MASNPFDQFDAVQSGNPFDQFDSAQPPAAPTMADQGKRQLGRTARIVAEGAAYLPLAVADFATGATNLVTGGNRQSPSVGFQEILDRLGLPRAQGTTEKVVDFLGQSLVGAALPSPAAKSLTAPIGKTVPSAPVGKTVIPQAGGFMPPDPARAVIAEGEKRGVPVFYDDVAKGVVAKKIGTAAESLPGPFGTGVGREAQASAAQTAATKLVDKFAPNVSDDVPELVQKGLQAKLGTFRKTAGKLYERAATELDPKGMVPRTNMDTVMADELIKQQRLGTLANDEVVGLIKKYQQGIPGANFTLMRELRSQLGADISDFYTGKNAAIGERGVTTLTAMKEALEKDMEAFAKQAGGKGYQAWRNADGFYKANLVPFKEAGFRDLVKTAEPEKAWRYLLAQGSLKSRSARMYNSLDDAGRGAVRYGLVKDAMEGGTNPNGSFSPAKFAKYLEDHDAAVNAFFKGSDRQEIQGFKNLMRHIERAGQFAENPPTGNRLIPYLLGGAAVVSPGTAATVAGSGVSVRLLFQTKAGRDMLLAAGRAKPGSAQMAQISEQMAKFLAAAAGTAALKNNQPDKTQPESGK